MTQRRKLMRDGDDDAVDVLPAFRRGHEGIEIRRRDVHRNADRVRAPGDELAGEAGRRPSLADRVAENEMKARLAVEGWKHLDPLRGSGATVFGGLSAAR